MDARGTVISTALDLIVEDCIECNTLFAMTRSLRQQRLDDHKTFYCPNGHSMVFTGPTEAQQERAAREKAERKAERLAQQLASREEDLRAARVAHAATKGQLTKTRKRAEKGVCLHCQRSFANVARHVEHMHPEAVASA